MEGKIMRVISLGTVTANGNTDTTVSQVTPNTRGRDAVLVLEPNTAFDGTIQVLCADADGTTYVEKFAATDLTGGIAILANIDAGRLMRVTGASISAGACRCYLLVGE